MPPSKQVPKTLDSRIAVAREQGRTQQALSLTQQLYKQTPNEAHWRTLVELSLTSAQQLQTKGKFQEAGLIFRQLASIRKDPPLLATLADGMLEGGLIADALELYALMPIDSANRKKFVLRLVDVALQQGITGRTLLPEELRAGFDTIEKCVEHVQAGRDDEARTLLQSIGLQSPYLEWKVLLRGLLAFYANDDVKAIENWQRLDATRLPARIAAILRIRIDPSFSQQLPGVTKNSLQAVSGRLQGSGLQSALEHLKKMLLKENLAPAFRQLELILPMLKKEAPQLRPRLEACVSWAIIHNGTPDDLDRYLRVFGPPSDDPNMNRLQALATERRELISTAHKAWHSYLKDIPKLPNVWPAAQVPLAQALIWSHMADVARNFKAVGAERPQSPLDFLFGRLPLKEEPLKPSVEECYQHSIKLAPQREHDYLSLISLHQENKDQEKARKLGEQFLQKFPKHGEVREVLADIAFKEKRFSDAELLYRQANQTNPLDRNLRTKLVRSLQNLALEHTLQQEYDSARKAYESALTFEQGATGHIYCQWAALEMKAKNEARAQELLTQAQAEPNCDLACHFMLACEAVRIKLTPARRKRFLDDFKKRLSEDFTPDEFAILIQSAVRQRTDRTELFSGQKTREKELLKVFERIDLSAFSESSYQKMIRNLFFINARSQACQCLEYADVRYPKNPRFHLLWVEYYLTARNPGREIHYLKENIDKARKYAMEMPRGEEQEQFLEEIRLKDKRIGELQTDIMPFMGMFGGFTGGFGDDGDDDDDY